MLKHKHLSEPEWGLMRTPLDLPLVQFDDKFVVLVDGPSILRAIMPPF